MKDTKVTNEMIESTALNGNNVKSNEGQTMKAVIWTKYGPPEVLKIEDVDKPIPQDNEVLIKVIATTVFPGDAELRRFQMPFWVMWIILRLWFGVFKPRGRKILGQEIAGVVEAVGKDVTRLKCGDQVHGVTGMRFGGYAEYICLTEEFTAGKGLVVIKPDSMSYAEAAAVPVGGLNAWHFIRRANLQPGEKMLINGAGGSIGSYAVQMAKSFGVEVTATDHTDKLELLRTIGADHVIDYTKEDFSKSGKIYDVILDIADKKSFRRCVRSLKANGRLLIVNTRPLHLLRRIWFSWFNNKQLICEIARVSHEDFDSLRDLVETGKVKTIIDRSYSLNKIVEAHRYVDTGLKKGHVILNVLNGTVA
jgi:NADPH:quinone reductase-like Zn-dependent oxidoreductase